MEGLVRGKKRILLYLWLYGKQEGGVNELARKIGYTTGSGNFNVYFNELLERGLIKQTYKDGRSYVSITLRGVEGILQFVLPELLTFLIFLTSLVLIMDALLLGNSAAMLRLNAFVIGLVLFVFSAAAYLLERMRARSLVRAGLD